MKQHRKRKCRNCRELFHPDYRNLRHQHYCSKPACRKASKAASQRCWLGKAQNRDYFRGTMNMQRVQAWRTAHPGYWKRTRGQIDVALQEHSLMQPTENKGKSQTLAELALQDVLGAQPAVLIGLIANLTGTALQEDIAQTGRQLRKLGYDILSDAHAAEGGGGSDAKTLVGPFTGAPGPPAVQLGGPASGA